VISGWNVEVDGMGNREMSSHICTAMPTATAAPCTDISSKSVRTAYCAYVCMRVYGCVNVCVCMHVCECVLVVHAQGGRLAL